MLVAELFTSNMIITDLQKQKTNTARKTNAALKYNISYVEDEFLEIVTALNNLVATCLVTQQVSNITCALAFAVNNYRE